MLIYIYDAEGTPIGMQYRKTTYAANEFDTYWFEKNLQGDIVAVYSEDGTKLISYTYDAWGNFTTTYSNGGAATTATYNPFTYRGYYYDTELGLYYLNSRYYDSNTGRFINVDSFISTGQGLIAFNMYAYCLNNSVMRIDVGGYVSKKHMSDDFMDDYGISAMGGRIGGGFGSDIYYDSTAYGTYTIRSINATYDANLSGYFYGGVSSSIVNPSYYIVPRAQTVGDDTATSSAAIPRAAYEVADYVQTHNGTPMKNYKGGRTYENFDGRLPSGSYKEYDIYPYVKGVNRGPHRIVISDSGKIWYTWDHYLHFYRIK